MNIAVIFAGGVGSRMGIGGVPKQFLPIKGKPILAHTLSVFQMHDDIQAIVLVMVEEWITKTVELVEECGFSKVERIVPGGATGQLSIYEGLVAASDYAREEGVDESDCVVLIHDGVRPVIDQDLITRNINGVLSCGSAITCVPCKETVVMVDESGERISRTIQRDAARIAKAPQSFRLSDVLEAHKMALNDGQAEIIDSCTIMQEYSSISPAVVLGDYDNIKVTTPEDYYTLKTLLDYHAGILEAI